MRLERSAFDLFFSAAPGRVERTGRKPEEVGTVVSIVTTVEVVAVSVTMLVDVGAVCVTVVTVVSVLVVVSVL